MLLSQKQNVFFWLKRSIYLTCRQLHGVIDYWNAVHETCIIGAILTIVVCKAIRYTTRVSLITDDLLPHVHLYNSGMAPLHSCLYSQAAQHHRPLPGAHLRIGGWVVLGVWLVVSEDGHPSHAELTGLDVEQPGLCVKRARVIKLCALMHLLLPSQLILSASLRWGRVHITFHLISSDRISTDPISSELSGSGCVLKRPAVRSERSRSLSSDWSQPRRTGSLHSALANIQFRWNEVSEMR